MLKLNKEIHFWRTTNKQEIDFIINDKEIYAIEAKYNFAKANYKTLNYFSDNYKCKKYIVGLEGERKGKYPWEMIKELE